MPKKQPRMNRIRTVLSEKDRRQDWLAEKLGKSTTAVNNWCGNKAQPTIANLFIIANILGVDARELLAKPEDVDIEAIKETSKK